MESTDLSPFKPKAPAAVQQSRRRRWPVVSCFSLVVMAGALWLVGWPYPRYRLTEDVTLVFPRDFRGQAKVRVSDGGPRLITGNVEQIVFDPSGRAIHGNARPLFHWAHLRAEQDDGTLLPIWDGNYRKPEPGESLGVWSGGSGSADDFICFYVGGPDDQDAASRAFLREAYGPDGERLLPKKKETQG